MRHGKHRTNPELLPTRRERWAAGLAKAVCRIVGHDPDNRFTGDVICSRCRVGLGRWRS